MNKIHVHFAVDFLKVRFRAFFSKIRVDLWAADHTNGSHFITKATYHWYNVGMQVSKATYHWYNVGNASF